jgi:hypothetical protein
VAERRRPLAAISTQYARNGPLVDESREYTGLVARGLGRGARRQLLVNENGLRRATYKARRNIFEALEARFADERRAADLGLLVELPAGRRAFDVGALLEVARHDSLIGEFLGFMVARIGQSWSLIDANYFLDDLNRRTGVVRRWAPSLQKRAVSSLNSLPDAFEIWERRAGPTVTPIEMPSELAAIVIQERLADALPPLHAPEFAMLGLQRDAVVQLLWTCARRRWFTVDVVGDVVKIDPEFDSAASLLRARLTEAAGL